MRFLTSEQRIVCRSTRRSQLLTHRSTREVDSGTVGIMPSKTGKFLGIPYDWRRPTVARLKSRWWNPKDRRLFTPKTWGWGFDINLARLFRRR